MLTENSQFSDDFKAIKIENYAMSYEHDVFLSFAVFMCLPLFR
jgi:hypothetical protein